MRTIRYSLTILLLSLFLGPVAAQSSADRARDHYRSGRSELEHGNLGEAVREFDRVIRLESGNEEGAYYWKAYALFRMGRSQEALGSLAERRQEYPDGRWANDARALELEIKGSAGRTPDPEAEKDQELKLIALNALIHVDEERAIPIVEKILAEETSFQMKEQALFVLVQSGSPRAREILLEIARGGANPDLQIAALQHMGMFGDTGNTESILILKEIYASSNDREVKQAIIMSYGISEASTELVAVIETEPDGDLRREALMHLGHAGDGSELGRLYERLTSTEDRLVIVEAMAMSGESQRLEEIIRTEPDGEVRQTAIRSLGFTGDPDTAGFLLEIYRDASSQEAKEAVLDSLMMQEAAAALIEIARTETDAEAQKHAVQMLAMMNSPEATEYLLKILDE